MRGGGGFFFMKLFQKKTFLEKSLDQKKNIYIYIYIYIFNNKNNVNI